MKLSTNYVISSNNSGDRFTVNSRRHYIGKFVAYKLIAMNK
ncbi:uncharacterized protein METZ01_LOCUS488952, partial [marine metagenome]